MNIKQSFSSKFKNNEDFYEHKTTRLKTPNKGRSLSKKLN